MSCIREVETKKVVCDTAPHSTLEDAMAYAKQFSEKKLEIVEWIVAIYDAPIEKEPDK